MSTTPATPPTIAKIQQMSEDLRAGYEQLMAGEDIAAPAEIRAIVTEWVTSVLPAIDARITRCHDLIKRGLCSEAIDYALESPNLFEAVKLLDLQRFGRRKYTEWMEASRAAGLLLPPAPKFDLFGDIEAAHDHLAEMRPLLEQWRRMNIQRAPLPQRIRMLRDLKARDAGSQSLVWETMLHDHEAHRLMEIKAGIARMREQLAHEGAPDLQQLEQEIERVQSELQDEWSTPPPPEVCDQATTLLTQARQRNADEVIDALVMQLEEAHSELGTRRSDAKEKLISLLEAWNQALVARGVIDPADSRLLRVRTILEYAEGLRDIDRLTREVGHLVGERPVMLKARLAWAEELGRMMDRIDAVASRLPPEDVDPRLIRELSLRVGDVSEAVQSEALTKRFLVVSTIAVAVIAVAAGGWAVYASGRHEADVWAAIAAADELIKQIEAGKDQGADPAKAWRASLQRDPRVAAAIERVAHVRQARADRDESLANQLDGIASALAELQKEKRPDPMAPWPEAFARATALLASARRTLVTVDKDRAQLEQPTARLRIKAKEYGEAADDAFEAEVGRLEADVSAIGLTMKDDPARAEELLEEAEAALEKLRGIATVAACPQAVDGYEARKLISPAMAATVANDSKVASALKQLRTRRGVMAGIADRESQADQLLAAGRYPEYADAIRGIGEDVGSGPSSRDYIAVARDHTLWQAVADWQGFVAQLGNPTTCDAKIAEDTLARLRALKPETTRLFDARETKRWLEPALEQLVANTPEKIDELKGKFKVKLKSQNGSMLDAVVWEKTERPPQPEYPRYYCEAKQKPLPDRQKTIKFVKGRPDQKGNWPTGSLLFDPELHEVADSPQKIIALTCQQILEQAPTAGFVIDRMAIEVLERCANPAKPAAGQIAIDPCLQSLLLRYLVVHACDASPFLKQRLAKSMKNADGGTSPDGSSRMIAGVDNEVFHAVLDPTKQDDAAWVRDERRRCGEFVRLVATEVAAALRDIDARDQSLAANSAAIPQFRCVGRLRRLAAGGWAISGGDPGARAGKQLFIAGGPQDDYKMVPCLKCDGKGQVPPGSGVNARAGDPVFVKVGPAKAG